MSDTNDDNPYVFDKINDIEQGKISSEEIIKLISDEKKNLEEKLSIVTQNIKEIKQENLLLNEIDKIKSSKSISTNKKLLLTVIIVLAISTSALAMFVISKSLVHEMDTQTQFGTGYVIQNLKGDVVNTWVSWNIPTDHILTVKIANDAKASPEQIHAVRDAILSTEFLSIDDSLLHKGPPGTSSIYYEGWEGALEHISKKTMFYVPTKFAILDSGSEGDIDLDLTNSINGDGFTGYTKSLSDQHQILKSYITIYNVDNLSANQLSAIVRHEFGHAIGLAHSTTPEDLMHATIQTEYPYISQCDINATTALYDGSKSSQVMCSK